MDIGTEGTPYDRATDHYTYDAFGVPLATSGATPNVYRFTGEQWDDSLGLYYLRARYYALEQGRFLTLDSYPGAGMVISCQPRLIANCDTSAIDSCAKLL